MKNIKYYAYPSTTREAVALLANKKMKALALAGGTLVAKTLPDTVETYLDLKGLPIKSIKLGAGSLVIGAGATFDEIDRDKLCRSWAGGVISAAAAKCSSQLIRNMATIGGNIARPHSFNIFPVVLLGLDARVRLQNQAGSKVVDFKDLYSPALKMRPGVDCLITEIIIPGKTRKWRCEFIKLAKTDSSWESYITLFLAAGWSEATQFNKNRKKGRNLAQVRIAVGALGPKPFRATAAEQAALAGDPAAYMAFAAELEAAKAGEYRVSAASSLLERFLQTI